MKTTQRLAERLENPRILSRRRFLSMNWAAERPVEPAPSMPMRANVCRPLTAPRSVSFRPCVPDAGRVSVRVRCRHCRWMRRGKADLIMLSGGARAARRAHAPVHPAHCAVIALGDSQYEPRSAPAVLRRTWRVVCAQSSVHNKLSP